MNQRGKWCSLGETIDEIHYREQQNLINEVAKELDLVTFRPNYHHDKNDPNTVLLYTAADEKHNKEIDSVYNGAAYARELYKRPVFTFENTDANGSYTYDWANRGKVDLRSYAEWKTRLTGAIKLAYYQHEQFTYVRKMGGWAYIMEADDTYNDFNRQQIEAFYQMYGHAYMCDANYHDEEHEMVVAGTQSVYTEYQEGQHLYNFCCTYLVPTEDETLQELIRDWNRSKIKDPDVIRRRVKAIGGIYFCWF